MNLSEMKYWHVGYLVEEMDVALQEFSQVPGCQAPMMIVVVDFASEDMLVGAPFQAKCAMLYCNGEIIELLQPIECPDSVVMRDLKKRGPGLHHFAYAVPDEYDITIQDLKEQGWVQTMESNRENIRACFIQSPSGSIVYELIECLPD